MKRLPGDSVGCLGDDYCPPQCNCAGSIVRCSRSRLTEIPRGIPPETTELYLDVNDIKTIHPERLNHLKILTRLWVKDILLLWQFICLPIAWSNDCCLEIWATIKLECCPTTPLGILRNCRTCKYHFSSVKCHTCNIVLEPFERSFQDHQLQQTAVRTARCARGIEVSANHVSSIRYSMRFWFSSKKQIFFFY